MPARHARASSLGDAVLGARVVFFFTSLYFCGLHGAAASSQVQLCGTLLSQSAEPDLSQLFFSVLPIVSIEGFDAATGSL